MTLRLPRLLSLLWATAIWIAGCEAEPPAAVAPRSPSGPILLVAVDGLEWNVLSPLLADGKLPRIEQLMNRGLYGLLETYQPTSSPVIWTTVATGKPAEEHGILSFAYRDSEGQLGLFDNRHRTTKAIWNIASDYGRSVATVGWWMTYPVEEIHGVMVAQTNTTAQLDFSGGRNIWKGSLQRGIPGQVYPPTRQNEMIHILERTQDRIPQITSAIFGLDATLPADQTRLLERRLWDNCLWAFRADATYLEIATRLLREEPNYDLTMLYLGGSDVVGHRFWRYREPELYADRPDSGTVAQFGRVIPDYYRFVDAALGELMSALPPDGTLIAISDHGMGPVNQDATFGSDDPPEDVNSGHHLDAPPGVLIAAGPRVARAAYSAAPGALGREELMRLGSVYDIAPTLLQGLGLPLAEDMRGQPLAAIFGAANDDSPERVPTHDTEEFRASRPTTPRWAPDEAERIEQLRALGYVGD
ncbi:MAG: hypothetical protein DHS20C21_12320 [Gemmatimonadota bacterium]|nr:MAG: hypothetical protein DHS20C21_12320 [Gemmatimonadota bacterium]